LEAFAIAYHGFWHRHILKEMQLTGIPPDHAGLPHAVMQVTVIMMVLLYSKKVINQEHSSALGLGSRQQADASILRQVD
jgi:hypothetical protein